MRSEWAFSCLSVLVLVFGIAPAPTAAPETRIRRVETGLLRAVVLKGDPAPMSLADRMAYYNVPGVSVAVINNGEIEWAKGYGIMEAGGRRPVTPRTRFQAASISKPVTAMAALALVQQGTLSLDEDVNRQLKSWHVRDNQFVSREKVTLRRLLNHSAGMTGADVGSYVAGRPLPTLVQALDGEKPANTAPIRVDVLPGSTWRYSGGGYSMVQLLMTEVTGKPFAELLQTLVLNKIGMTDSTFQQPTAEEWQAVSATGHDVNGHPIEGRWRTFPEAAAAGLSATASDLARFTIELQRSLHGQSNNVVSEDTTRQMLTKQLGDYGLGIGLGERARVETSATPGGMKASHASCSGTSTPPRAPSS
jgi:CubicO group peptidase (beta-lactamase class C family)